MDHGLLAALSVSICLLALSEATPASRVRAAKAPDVLASWFWSQNEFEPNGYRGFIDRAAERSPFTLLTTSIRAPKEVTDPAVHDQVKAAAAYARSKGIRIAMDLDVRLARDAFRKAYPDELQEMARLREIELTSGEPARLTITSAELADHYTYNSTPYVATEGRLERVYCYTKGPDGIDPESIEDITKACVVEEALPRQVSVRLPTDRRLEGQTACVIAVFTHFAPDVFAPHLLEFQRQVLSQYRDTEIAGACKDEWGFPPCFDGCPEKNDFWYSRNMAEAYRRLLAGRDLVRDFVLMHTPVRGRERERQAAINHLALLSRSRNIEVELDFYRAVKATFGRAAWVCTHPTWFPIPDSREFMKNGLDWWGARRDVAQTDEITPYCARTALAKKWGGPWFNMYYSSEKPDYYREIWADCLAGGRVNYHPIYPAPSVRPIGTDHDNLFDANLMRGESRVRLLGCITRAALDCPVAVIFGHACATNWAGPHYNDVGLALADALWRAGYPTDLIPTSEIETHALSIASDGRLRYGSQNYAAAVIYHPEFESLHTAQLIQRAARGGTVLFRSGEWTVDADAEPFDGSAALSGLAKLPSDPAAAAEFISNCLGEMRIAPQAPAVEIDSAVWGTRITQPPTKGHSRLVDGTHIIVSGSAEHPEGERIMGEFDIDGHKLAVDAAGLCAIRLDCKGGVEALAAGGLKQVECGSLDLTLDAPLDLAIWRDARGKTRGVVQGLEGPLPAALRSVTDKWECFPL